MAKLIEGKIVAKKYSKICLTRFFSRKKPCLAVIIAGDDAASKIYVNSKRKKPKSSG